MPQGSDEPQGPSMLCITKVLDPGGLRIARIVGNVTLPRTVPLKSLLAGAAGAVVGLIVSLIVGVTVQSIMFGLIFGATGGVLAVTYSPLKGEPLWRWASLAIAARRRQITVDGRPVSLAVGICRISSPAMGSVRIVPGAVDISPSQFDERGALISARNMNLDRAASNQARGGTDVLAAALAGPGKALAGSQVDAGAGGKAQLRGWRLLWPGNRQPGGKVAGGDMVPELDANRPRAQWPGRSPQRAAGAAASGQVGSREREPAADKHKAGRPAAEGPSSAPTGLGRPSGRAAGRARTPWPGR